MKKIGPKEIICQQQLIISVSHGDNFDINSPAKLVKAKGIIAKWCQHWYRPWAKRSGPITQMVTPCSWRKIVAHRSMSRWAWMSGPSGWFVIQNSVRYYDLQSVIPVTHCCRDGCQLVSISICHMSKIKLAHSDHLSATWNRYLLLGQLCRWLRPRSVEAKGCHWQVSDANAGTGREGKRSGPITQLASPCPWRKWMLGSRSWFVVWNFAAFYDLPSVKPTTTGPGNLSAQQISHDPTKRLAISDMSYYSSWTALRTQVASTAYVHPSHAPSGALLYAPDCVCQNVAKHITPYNKVKFLWKLAHLFCEWCLCWNSFLCFLLDWRLIADDSVSEKMSHQKTHTSRGPLLYSKFHSRSPTERMPPDGYRKFSMCNHVLCFVWHMRIKNWHCLKVLGR